MHEEAATAATAATAAEPKEEATNIVLPFSCPVCGKTFATAAALKGHFGATGHKPAPAAEGAEKPTERGRPPKYMPTIEEAGIPDALTLLRNQLILYGVNSRDADAVTDFMKSYEVDDLIALSRALDDIGMARNRKRLFLQSWINARNIPLSRVEAERLGLLDVERGYDWRRAFGYGGYDYSRDEEGRESLQKPQGIDVTALLIAQQKEQASILRTLLEKNTQPIPKADSNPEVESLRSEISELRSKLDEERARREEAERKRLEEKLASLEKTIEELKRSATDEKTAVIRELTDTIKEVIRKEPSLKGTIKEALVASTRYSMEAMGVTEEYKPPTVKVGESSVADMLPPEYVEDEKSTSKEEVKEEAK